MLRLLDMHIQHLQKAIDYVQKTERKFLLVEGIQQTDFDTVMPIDASSKKIPKRQERLNLS